MNEPLVILPDLVIPTAELQWRFDTAGGPGGQHANRAASRAELSFDLGASPSVPNGLRDRMLENLGRRAHSGIITVAVDDSRSQWRNRAIARKRMARLLEDATRVPRLRHRTKPSRRAKQRRRAAKRHRSETKRLRRRPDLDA